MTRYNNTWEENTAIINGKIKFKVKNSNHEWQNMALCMVNNIFTIWKM